MSAGYTYALINEALVTRGEVTLVNAANRQSPSLASMLSVCAGWPLGARQFKKFVRG